MGLLPKQLGRAASALWPRWGSRPVASPNVQMANGLSQDVARPWRLECPGRHDPTSPRRVLTTCNGQANNRAK